MPALPSYFDHFLKEVRPTQNQRDDCKVGHETLRDRLQSDEPLKDIMIDTFLQGSYRRATAVRSIGDSKLDVDVIAVTSLDKAKYTPKQAMALFVPFLDKHYKGKWKAKGRSFGINLSYVKLDLVVTAAPSQVQAESWRELAQLNESDLLGETTWKPAAKWFPKSRNDHYLTEESDWKLDPLNIPDREANEWDKTHPLAQIAVTWDKNRSTNSNYVNVVKAVKWWKVSQQTDMDYPKGYPIEHLLWVSCPNHIESVAQGIVLALEDMAARYQVDVDFERVPFVKDHGVQEHNVLGRLSLEDFKEFHQRVCIAAGQARDAFDETDVCDSAEKWRLLLGPKFPQCPDNAKKGDYTPRKEVSIIPGGRFA